VSRFLNLSSYKNLFEDASCDGFGSDKVSTQNPNQHTHHTMLTPRRFDFVRMWGVAVVFIYFMRRVNCSDCGIRVEQVSWADGKSPVTHELKWFLGKDRTKNLQFI